MPLSDKTSCLIVFVIALSCLSIPAVAQTSDDETPREVGFGPGGQVRLEKPKRAKPEEEYELYAHVLWESRYVTEGRDNLSGDALYSASTEFEYRGMNIVPWIATAADSDYSEFNLNIVYGLKPVDKLELFIGYNHIQFSTSDIDDHDNEISLGTAYLYRNQLQLLAIIYHSFEANGAFSEVTLKKSFQIDDALIIDTSAILGINTGYVTDGHKGMNHGQLLANASYLVIDELEVYAYTGYNKAIDRDINRYSGDELLRDFFWAGAGLIYQF